MIKYFLLTNESPDQGLIKSQLIDPLENNFIQKYKIINILSPRFALKKLVANNLVKFPFLIPPRFLSKYTIVFYFINLLTISIFIGFYLKITSSDKYEIIARNYFSGFIALIIKILFKVDFIFDPRSLFILENLGYKFTKNSLIYSVLKLVEKIIVKKSKKVICVSYGMKKYFSLTYKKKALEIIPCFNNLTKNNLIHLTAQEEIRISKLLSMPEDTIKIIYYGSLNYGWNNINTYFKFIEQSNQNLFSFIIITQDYKKDYCNKLKNLKNVYIFSLKTIPLNLTITQIFYYADYGLLLLNKSLDWYTRLSVKYAQYTSHGLPVITTKWAGEASRLNKNFFNRKDLIINRNIPSNLTKPTKKEKKDISNLALKYFDSNKINLYDA